MITTRPVEKLGSIPSPDGVQARKNAGQTVKAEEEQPYRHAVSLSILCSLCSKIFGQVSQQRDHLTLRFYSAPELIKAKQDTCAFCALLLDSIHKCQIGNRKPNSERLYGTRSQRPLIAGIQFYQDLGLSFSLWYKKNKNWDFITGVTLKFSDAPIWFEYQSRISESTCTSSKRSWGQIIDWVQSCSDSHNECCTSQGAGTSYMSHLPARLIEVGEVGSLTVRVRETSNLNLSVSNEYMTLSHCWGLVGPKKLLTTNYLTMLEGIRVGDLPTTFAEAVQIARILRIGYLWIDSLCIIQDSAADWGIESIRMFHIYRNSYLNIGAASSLDANGGLFSSLDPQKTPPCILTIGRSENSRYIASEYDPENDLEGDNQCALFTRAWVFQELLLAPRTLFFGKHELFWECRRLRGTETIPQQEKHHPGYDGLRKAMRELWENLDQENYQNRLGVWCEIVRQYSEKQLTKVADKLVAVSGLASHLGRSWSDVTYLAGLWSFQLRRGLLWHVVQPQPKRHKDFIAPSWSWASATGTITPSGFSLQATFEENISEFRDGLIKILDAGTTQASTSSLYGQVKGGDIRLKGPLFRAKIVKLSGRSWELDFKDCRAVFSNLDLHVQEKIPMLVNWDDWEMEDMAEGLNIYLAPFEIHLNSKGKLVLEGLLLLPTHSTEGQYRRLGLFSVQDNLLKSKKQHRDTKTPVGSSSVQGSGLSDDGGQDSDTIPSHPLHITHLDVIAFAAEIAEEDKLLEIERSSSSNNGPFQRMKRRLDPWQDCPSASPNEISTEPEDPYWNGVVNTKLVNRYHDTLSESEYLNINSFFAAASWTIYKEGLVGGSQVSHEEDHGDDYFTFSII